MGKDAIVAGTGFSNPDGTLRADIIRRHVKDGMRVSLKREPSNPHDPNAIAVFLPIPRLFGLLGTSLVQIGYLKASAAKGLAAKIDSGLAVAGSVKSSDIYPGLEHPRVSLRLDWPDS